MENVSVIIFGAEVFKMKDKDGNYTIEATRIHFGIPCENTDRTIGASRYECVRLGNHLKILTNYLMRTSKCTLVLRNNFDNTIKPAITKIDNHEL